MATPSSGEPDPTSDPVVVPNNSGEIAPEVASLLDDMARRRAMEQQRREEEAAHASRQSRLADLANQVREQAAAIGRVSIRSGADALVRAHHDLAAAYQRYDDYGRRAFGEDWDTYILDRVRNLSVHEGVPQDARLLLNLLFQTFVNSPQLESTLLYLYGSQRDDLRSAYNRWLWFFIDDLFRPQPGTDGLRTVATEPDDLTREEREALNRALGYWPVSGGQPANRSAPERPRHEERPPLTGETVPVSLDYFHTATIETYNHGLAVYDDITVFPGEPPVSVTGYSCKVIPGDRPTLCPQARPVLPPSLLPVALCAVRRMNHLPAGTTIHWVGHETGYRNRCLCHPTAPYAAPFDRERWADVAAESAARQPRVRVPTPDHFAGLHPLTQLRRVAEFVLETAAAAYAEPAGDAEYWTLYGVVLRDQHAAFVRRMTALVDAAVVRIGAEGRWAALGITADALRGQLSQLIQYTSPAHLANRGPAGGTAARVANANAPYTYLRPYLDIIESAQPARSTSTGESLPSAPVTPGQAPSHARPPARRMPDHPSAPIIGAHLPARVRNWLTGRYLADPTPEPLGNSAEPVVLVRYEDFADFLMGEEFDLLSSLDGWKAAGWIEDIRVDLTPSSDANASLPYAVARLNLPMGRHRLVGIRRRVLEAPTSPPAVPDEACQRAAAAEPPRPATPDRRERAEGEPPADVPPESETAPIVTSFDLAAVRGHIGRMIEGVERNDYGEIDLAWFGPRGDDGREAGGLFDALTPNDPGRTDHAIATSGLSDDLKLRLAELLAFGRETPNNFYLMRVKGRALLRACLESPANIPVRSPGTDPDAVVDTADVAISDGQAEADCKPATDPVPTWAELGDAKRAILEALHNASGRRLDGKEVASKAGYSHGTVRQHLGDLQRWQYIDRARGGYALTPAGAALVSRRTGC
jgi:hypothetical protein